MFFSYKKLIPTLTIFLIIISNCTIAAKKEEKCYAQYNNGKNKIYSSDVIENLKKSYNTQLKEEEFDTLPEEEKRAIIKSYVLIEILQKEAEASNMFKKGGKLFTKYEDAISSIKKQLLIEEKLDKLIKDDETHSEYSAYVSELKSKGEVKIKCVLFRSEEDARNFISNIKSGKQSFDTKDKKEVETSMRAGYVLTPMSWPEEVEKKIFSLKEGNISDPISFSNNTVIVVKILAKNKVKKIPSFESKKEDILSKLKTKYLNIIMQDLEKKYDVKITL